MIAHYLGNITELDNDVGPLLWGGLGQHHALYPLGEPVEQGDGALQLRVVLQGRCHCIVLEVCKLSTQEHL